MVSDDFPLLHARRILPFLFSTQQSQNDMNWRNDTRKVGKQPEALQLIDCWTTNESINRSKCGTGGNRVLESRDGGPRVFVLEQRRILHAPLLKRKKSRRPYGS